MNGRSEKARWTMAWALTLVLTLQAVFTGLALADTDVPAKLDPFGNVLCLSSADAESDGGRSPHDHSKVPDCCTFACSMFWSQLPAPDGSAAIDTFSALAAGTPPALVERVASSFLDHRRSYPRAPPMMA